LGIYIGTAVNSSSRLRIEADGRIAMFFSNVAEVYAHSIILLKRLLDAGARRTSRRGSCHFQEEDERKH